MSAPREAAEGATALSGPPGGHENCRANEFARWPRIVLEHEREHLSRVMDGAAFLQSAEREATLHDITDIDWFLAFLEPRLEV